MAAIPIAIGAVGVPTVVAHTGGAGAGILPATAAHKAAKIRHHAIVACLAGGAGA